MSVIDNDKGWKRIKESLKTSTSFVKVGVLSSAEKPEGSSMSMAKLAAIHEFGAKINHPGGTPYIVTKDGAVFVNKGTKGISGVTKAHQIVIPARPFLKQTIDKIKNDIIKFNKEQLDSIIKGKTTTGKALRALGVYVVREVKKEFRTGNFTPLKPSTIRAKTVNGKKGTTPLIDTGRLRNSINFEVIE